ncbi:hypothetical protein [Teredinibacter haidensis]|uniref:hypothetical protein n=1 Tax=Teredinibacter haidensis TaxID=2731755 RepID=UPI000948A76D|nr:hypothetical protein [Teredinibacter haidensis]
MSLQQVNLYLPELRPKKEWLTTNSLFFSVVGIIAIYVAFYFIAVANLDVLEQQVVELENQQLATKKQLEKFKAKANPFQSNQLEPQLEYLRAALKGREHVGEIITWQNLGNADGFVNPLKALARQSMPSISLEKISLSRGGQHLQLRGQTQAPEDIATYIQILQQEPSLVNTSFGLLSVAAQKNSQHHLFTLGFSPVYSATVEERE